MAQVVISGFDMSELPPEGLWISPEGKAMPINEHLVAIRDNPELFGIPASEVTQDLDQVRKLAEGLIAQGWTRYRYLDGQYHFEVDNVRRRIRIIDDILLRASALEQEIVVITASDGTVLRGTVGDVHERAIFKMASKQRDKWAWAKG